MSRAVPRRPIDIVGLVNTGHRLAEELHEQLAIACWAQAESVLQHLPTHNNRQEASHESYSYSYSHSRVQLEAVITEHRITQSRSHFDMELCRSSIRSFIEEQLDRRRHTHEYIYKTQTTRFRSVLLTSSPLCASANCPLVLSMTNGWQHSAIEPPIVE